MAEDSSQNGFWHNVMKWFTPPKKQTPWTAMTKDSTGGWASGLEQWGPVLNSIGSWLGNAVFPGAGTVGGSIGGGIGMEGKNTGYQGSDYGWGNVAPTVAGIMEGSQAGTPMGTFGNIKDTAGSYWNNGQNPIGGYNKNYDFSTSPYANTFNWGQLGNSVGSAVGNYYGGSLGSMIGGNVGSQAGGQLNQYQQGNPNLPQGQTTQAAPSQAQGMPAQAMFAKQQQEDMKKQKEMEEEEKLRKLLMAMQLTQLNSGGMGLPQLGGMTYGSR